MANTLFLRLEGPLQAWGERGRWSERDTGQEPSKSGVVGLLACALGVNDDEGLRELCDALRLGVRCDRPGSPLVDFHTVVGGVRAADGRIKVNANTKRAETVVSRRYYLCDASFLVAVQGPEEMISRLAKAVQRPAWPLYLGRRSCVPALPPYAGVGKHASLEAALEAQPLPCRGKQAKSEALVRAVVECEPGEGVWRRDAFEVPSHRTFAPRYVRELLVQVRVATEEE